MPALCFWVSPSWELFCGVRVVRIRDPTVATNKLHVMRIASLTVVMVVSRAVGQHSPDPWPAVVTSSTNVDDSVLRIEFADSKAIAGDRLFGRMVV